MKYNFDKIKEIMSKNKKLRLKKEKKQGFFTKVVNYFKDKTKKKDNNNSNQDFIDKKILGIYAYYVGEGKDRTRSYCYILEDEDGNKEYKFTDDEEFARSLLIKYVRDKGYTKMDKQALYNDQNIKVGAKTAPNAGAMLNSLSDEDRANAFDAYEEAKKEATNDETDDYDTDDGLDDEEIEENKDKKPEKKKKKHPMLKPALISLATIVGLSSIGLILSRDKTPTNGKSMVATTIDDPNLDDLKNQAQDNADQKQAELEAKKAAEEAQAQAQAQAAAAARNVNYNSDYSSGGGSSYIPAANVTQTPGSINQGYENLNYQEPQTLPDHSNDNTNTGNDNTEEDKYDNIITGEETNTDTGDQDYSQEIDVSTSSDGSLAEGDVNFNDDIPADAIEDGSLTTEVEENTNTATEPAPLPDQNATANAGNGDYDTTEEELQQSQNTGTVTEEVPVEQVSVNEAETTYVEPATNIETVEVYQEPTATFQEPAPAATTETMTNEAAAEAAVNAMASGELSTTGEDLTNQATNADEAAKTM